MTGQDWYTRISRANSEESLREICDEVKAAGEWSRDLRAACLDRLHALKPLHKRFGIHPNVEAVIRADERLKVLREVRKGASKLRNAEPYDYDASHRIVDFLTRLLAEQRAATGDQERVEAEKWERTQRNRAAAQQRAEREAAEHREYNRRSLARYLKGLAQATE